MAEERFMSRTLRELLAAGDTVIALATPEDGRGREAVADALREIPHRLSTWNCVDGVERQDDGTPPLKGLEGPDAILAHIRKAAAEDMRQQLADQRKAKECGTSVPPMRVVVWTLAGMQNFLSSARVRTLLLLLHTELRETMTRVVLLGPEHGLDKGLEKVIDVVRLPLPERDEVTEIARGALRSLEIDEEPSGEAVDALMGLTKVQADLALRRSLVFHDRPHAPSMLRAKADIFRDQGILDMTTPSTTLDDVGGQDELCAWVRARRRSFTPEGVRFVGRTPKGVLLVGVSGGGKTLAADAIAGTFGVPKLRLDMGKVFHHLVGSSEGRIRDALEVAERVAPAVLHVDEIEKAVAGVGGGGDSGVATRVFGTFIQWLSDKTAPVFVVATANDVMGVPPELLRKGRFDEMFFVDLPSAEERADILRIHVARRCAAGCGIGDPDGYDLAALAEDAEGFVGSELEQVVVDALVDAFDEDAHLVTQGHIAKAIRQTTPLSATRAESVEALRAWAKDRARFASSAAAARAGSKVVADVSARVAALERAGVVRLVRNGSAN